MGGWIKIYRKILDSEFYSNLTGRQRDVIITILLMADHERRSWEYNGVKYKTEPGQLLTNLKKIQEKCGKDCTRNIVRATLVNAEKARFLTIKTNNRWTLITIENWSLYQGIEPDEKQTSNGYKTNDKQTITTNNKNRRIKENKYSDDSIEIELSMVLYDEIKKNNGSFKEPNIQSWADHINKMIRIDNRNVDDIRAVIKYAQSNEFWKSNILSTSKLRAKFDTLYMQMPKPSKKVVMFKGDDGDDSGIKFY